MTVDRFGMTELAVHECLALLRSVEVGRLATIAEPAGFPEIFPINFVVDRGSLVFRTAEGSKLAALIVNHRVSVEADGYDREAGEAWSVVVKGLAEVVRQPQQRVEVLDVPLFPWHAAPKQHFVRVEPVEISGRRFHVVTATGSASGTPARQDAGE